MIPFHGVYLMLIMAGSPTVPERIGLEQQLNEQACRINAEKAVAKQQYFFVGCVREGAIMSPDLVDQPHAAPPMAFGPIINQFLLGILPP